MIERRRLQGIERKKRRAEESMKKTETEERERGRNEGPLKRNILTFNSDSLIIQPYNSSYPDYT